MSYEPLAWDSAFFDIPIARVSPPPGDDRALTNDVAEADAAGIRCLYLLIGAADHVLLNAAVDVAFRVCDIRITLERALEGTAPSVAGVRAARSEDLTELERLARARFTQTRFYVDARFPPRRVGDMYVAWVKRGLSTSPLRRTLVDDDAQGFIVCHMDQEASVGTIELICVAEDCVGRGVGRRLVQGATAVFLDAGLSSAAVVAQGHNVSAQRLYQHEGYRTRSVELWLHRWRM